jgi:tetratricopeptide (TPR) repeat protein
MRAIATMAPMKQGANREASTTPRGLLFGAIIVLAVILVYAGSLAGPFVFDDVPGILENPTLRQPADIVRVLTPPGDEAGTVGGRPVLNLSLALNYAWGGIRVQGYHAVNVGIHAAAALLLFGVLLRTLKGLRGEYGWTRPEKPLPWPESGDLPVAFLAALLWAVHPLQTEAVTYVIQRAESLMGLFYLLTLYAFIRYAAPGARRRLWALLAVAACLLGMATKEVMVTAPVVVLLFDRTLVSGTFRKAWADHRAVHVCLGATWILLAVLVIGTHGRGGSAGFASSAGLWPYALTQCGAIVDYLRLSFWPDPLIFDRGTALVTSVADAFLAVLLVAGLIAAAVYALCRRSIAGLAAFCFFVLLSPSSSIVPIATEPIAEHRMYLSLAAVCALAVAFLLDGLTRVIPRHALLALWLCGGGAAAALGAAAMARNGDYRSEVALWADTARKAPENPRAHNNLAEALIAAGRPAEALGEFEEAVRLNPNYAPAQYNLGVSLLDMGRPADAIPHLEAARSAPRHKGELHQFLGEALERVGRHAEAADAYREALRLRPSSAGAAFGLGNNLAAVGRIPEAVAALQTAVALDPTHAQVRNNLANAYWIVGRRQEAIAEYTQAARLDPQNASIRENLRLAIEDADSLGTP